MTSLWVDDLRKPPESHWVWVTEPESAIWMLDNHPITVLSLDHDLGGDLTSRPIVLWLCEQSAQKWPIIIRLHTANPVGREWLAGMIERYRP